MRIIYLATADARGHLMRSQILVYALRNAGAQVTVMTTSLQGQQFLQQFGIEAQLLSEHYAIQFDDKQNMLRKETNRNVLKYLIFPNRMLRDIWQLKHKLKDADMVINDSFHPALLFMGMLPIWRHKVVHIYGTSLKAALINNYEHTWPRPFALLFSWIVTSQINRALACFEHNFVSNIDDNNAPKLYRLPTPVALATSQAEEIKVDVAVYLNPHFGEPALANALEAGLSDAALSAHFVGEGYEAREGWLAVDQDWINYAANAQLILSAPGMAALSVAFVYQKPIILLVTDQPEQITNAERANALNLHHKVVTWQGDSDDFQRQVTNASMQLCSESISDSERSVGLASAQTRIDAWVERLLSLKEH